MPTIPDPGFADDDGAADPAVAAALARYASDFRPGPVLAALAGSRLLVPVMAVLGEQALGETGHVVDKSSDMAAVLMTGRDGRKALLAFTSSAALMAWNAAARPVPVAIQLAAVAACQEGAAGLLLDVAGPVRFVVQGDDLLHVAAGDTLMPVAGGHAWRPQTDTPRRAE